MSFYPNIWWSPKTIFSCRENITIAQSSPSGTELFIVNVSDADEPETPSVDIRFSLDDPTLPFSIDPDLGNLTTTLGLEVRSYNIVVIAADAGTPPRSSAGSFYVTVAAPNFYDPIFQDSLEFSVVEEQVQPKAAFEFSVRDADTGDEGRVSLVLIPTNYSDAFNLSYFYDNSQNLTVGQLIQVDAFDRESTTNFTLAIRAVDRGNELFRRTSEATIEVTILDVNDNSPIFLESPYSVRVAENANISSFILQVIAEDSDSGTNAEVDYKIDSDVTEFKIDEESGNISVIADLDRRLQSFYSFNITATDRGNPPLSSVTTVNVIVTEVNDNQPYFDPPLPGTITIPEDTEPGYILLNITARDNDTLSAGEVTIRLQQSGDVFALNEDNQLFLNQAVDYEVRM